MGCSSVGGDQVLHSHGFESKHNNKNLLVLIYNLSTKEQEAEDQELKPSLSYKADLG